MPTWKVSVKRSCGLIKRGVKRERLKWGCRIKVENVLWEQISVIDLNHYRILLGKIDYNHICLSVEKVNVGTGPEALAEVDAKRTVCIRHLCRKTIVFRCHRCLIKTRHERPTCFCCLLTLHEDRIEHIRHLCSRTTVLSHHRCVTTCFYYFITLNENRIEHIRHLCRKTTVLNCHRCLINTRHGRPTWFSCLLTWHE
jgi:hypothetical protein